MEKLIYLKIMVFVKGLRTQRPFSFCKQLSFATDKTNDAVIHIIHGNAMEFILQL